MEEKKSGVQRKSNFSKFKTGFGKLANKTGNALSNAAVAGKAKVAEKIFKVEPTPEVPDMIVALERLKSTKNEIVSLADIMKNLYEARVNETHYMMKLSEKLCSIEAKENDAFAVYVSQIGNGLGKLEAVQSEHLKKMEEELLNPLMEFKEKEIKEALELKLRYKKLKINYDVACKSVEKAQAKAPDKLEEANKKKQICFKSLTVLRDAIKKKVLQIENKKQTELLSSFQKYWASYTLYASAQSQVLQQNAIKKFNWNPNSINSILPFKIDQNQPHPGYKDQNPEEGNEADIFADSD